MNLSAAALIYLGGVFAGIFCSFFGLFLFRTDKRDEENDNQRGDK